MKKKQKGKKITVYSLKGGQGKTSISSNLALELGYGVITNDYYSPIETILPKGKVKKLEPGEILSNIKELNDIDIIFDFGGYLDERVIDALEISNYVIIPVTDFDKLNASGLVNTISEVKGYNSNIIIVLNKMLEEEARQVREELRKHNYPYPVFEIKKSNALKEVVDEGKPISEIVSKGGLKAYFYKSVNDQFTKLIKYLNKGE